MEHKYSTYILLGFLFIGSCVLITQALTSYDIDEVCNNDNALLIRIYGFWVCSDSVILEEDLRFPIQAIKLPGNPNDADIEIFRNSTIVLSFDDNIEEYGYITFQLPHGRLDNSDLKHHIHWTPSDNNTGSVKWCFEYTCSNINDYFNYTSVSCVIDNAEGEYIHHMTPVFTQSNSLGVSAMCIVKLYRDATAQEDNYSSDAYLLEYDVHYRPYSLGRIEYNG